MPPSAPSSRMSTSTRTRAGSDHRLQNRGSKIGRDDAEADRLPSPSLPALVLVATMLAGGLFFSSDHPSCYPPFGSEGGDEASTGLRGGPATRSRFCAVHQPSSNLHEHHHHQETSGPQTPPEQMAGKRSTKHETEWRFAPVGGTCFMCATENNIRRLFNSAAHISHHHHHHLLLHGAPPPTGTMARTAFHHASSFLLFLILFSSPAWTIDCFFVVPHRKAASASPLSHVAFLTASACLQPGTLQSILYESSTYRPIPHRCGYDVHSYHPEVSQAGLLPGFCGAASHA